MLDLCGLLLAWPAPTLVDIMCTFVTQLDRFNDRTTRPIPVAAAM